jgi:hypothetical protein
MLTRIQMPANLRQNTDYITSSTGILRSLPDSGIVFGTFEDVEVFEVLGLMAKELYGLNRAGCAAADQ